jgi:hypothetical protein
VLRLSLSLIASQRRSGVMRPAAGAQPAQHPGVLEPGRPGGRRHGGP